MVPSPGEFMATPPVLGMPIASAAYDMSKRKLKHLDKVRLFFDGLHGLQEPSFLLTADFAHALAELAKLHLAEVAEIEREGNSRSADLPPLDTQNTLLYAKPEKPLTDFSPNSWDQAVIDGDRTAVLDEEEGFPSESAFIINERNNGDLPEGMSPKRQEPFGGAPSATPSHAVSEFDRQLSPSSTNAQAPDSPEFELRHVWMADNGLVQRVVNRMNTSVSKDLYEEEMYGARARAKKVRELAPGNNIYQRSRSLLSLTTTRFIPIIHPESITRMTWDTIAAALLAYDGFHLPLQFFEFKKTTFTSIMDWVVAIYWTFDMAISCITGVYIDGKLVMRIKQITAMYLRTWFMFDLLLVSFEWILILDESSATSMNAVSSLRGLRALRFLRLLRLIKIRSLLSHFQRTINSMYALLCVDIVKHILSILFITHCVAGLWYYIGNRTEDGWVAILSEKTTASDSFMYLTAFHWGLCSFHGAMEVYPTNEFERLFAVVVVSLGLITFTMFVSSMTQSMLELQSLHAERVKQHRMLCNFLMDRKISRPLCVRIKNYLNHLDKQSELVGQDQHVKLLRSLPEPLLMEIYAEARAPILLTHILCIDIYEYYPRALLRICHSAIGEQGLQAAQCVFATGDVCNSVLIIESGSLIYVHQDGCEAPGTRIREVSKVVGDQDWLHKVCDDSLPDEEHLGERHHVRRSQWVSEASMWVKWEYRGVLVSQTHSRALRLHCQEFAQVISEFERAYVMAALYARSFLDFLNENAPHDILDVPIRDYLGTFRPNMTLSSSASGLHSL